MKNQPIILILLTAIILSACSQISYHDLKIDHVIIEDIISTTQNLEDNGPRNAGTVEEENTANLIVEKLDEAGIKTKIESFSYETFRITEAHIVALNRVIVPSFVGINPFEEPNSIEGQGLILNMERETTISPENKIVVSDNPDLFFLALQQGARAFVSISTKDLESLKQYETIDIKLEIKGDIQVMNTANLVADVGNNPEGTETIYITAHYDSFQDSPGANDNGTGLSSAIELAKLLKKAENSLPYNIKFIFPAAEEIGLVGSRSYVETHLEELNSCKCLINLDTFGGNTGPYIACAPGLNDNPDKGYTDPTPEIMRNRALEGPDASWRFFDISLFNILTSNNYPEWYQDIVSSSAKSLNYEITTQQLMSDHLSFAAAGVPSISIQSREHTIHSKEDLVENINFVNVEKCLTLTLQIVKNLMEEKGIDIK